MTDEERRKLNICLGVLADGNAEILDAIYALVGGSMFALAKSILVNRADAEDAVHDSLVKIALKISSYARGSNGYAWIMKIVRNTSLDMLRKRGNAVALPEGAFELSAADYDENKLAQAVSLEQAIDKLTPEEKKIIYYAYFLDLTVRAAANRLGISKSAAERLLQKAERHLKILLQDN